MYGFSRLPPAALSGKALAMALFRFSFAVLSLALLQACSTTSYPWPAAKAVSPPADSAVAANVSAPQPVSGKTLLADLSGLSQAQARDQARAQAMDMIAGRYGHYDVVAYEDKEAKPVMRTFVISYGFTEFLVQDGALIERDRFCYAEHKMSFKTVRTKFSDAATQAIIPVDKSVDLSFKEGQWHIVREPTPTLLGIQGDPNQPLSRDKNDPNLVDSDGDGKPGVTVNLIIGGIFKGKIYMTRREIFHNFMTVESPNRITGHVVDSSEQFILGANLKMLAKQSDPVQHPDPAMNPIILVRVGDDIQTCEQLKANRDKLFPPEPAFF